jgi:hypothetical protein
MDSPSGQPWAERAGRGGAGRVGQFDHALDLLARDANGFRCADGGMVIKVFLEECTDTTVVLGCPTVTGCVDVAHCARCTVEVGEAREAVEGVGDTREHVAGEVERRQRAAAADLVGQRREAVATEVEFRQDAQVAERGRHVAQEIRGEVWLTNK